MKTSLFSKYALSALCLCASLFILSCDKDNDNDDDDMNVETTHMLSGDASGSQEVPVVSTSATGRLTGSYNRNTNRLDYTVTWTGLSGIATAAHLHGPAEPGVNANVLLPLNITANAAANGQAKGTATLSDDAEIALLDGTLYYNIHTAAHVDGEIRGQVITSSN
jgi:hypothetical protein